MVWATDDDNNDDEGDGDDGDDHVEDDDGDGLAIWREPSVSQGPFPVHVPSTARVVLWFEVCFFFLVFCSAECAVALVSSLHSGVCICMTRLILGRSTTPVHWMRRDCTHGVPSLCRLKIFSWKKFSSKSPIG